MRILFTIPNFHKLDKDHFDNIHASRSTAKEHRAAVLLRCLNLLYRTFDAHQGMLRAGDSMLHPNARYRQQIKVVICTNGDDHCLDLIPDHLYDRHRDDEGDPRYLGFACHDVMAAYADDFDYFCYLEDDIFIQDPLLFQKLDWFVKIAGNDCLLQPNRFEADPNQGVRKLYLDGNISRRGLSERFQDISIRPEIEAEHLGQPVRFRRVNNVHAGCFFINRAQLRHWMAQAHFGDTQTKFIGPLESAATLCMMRTFKVYKPCYTNASFLEVQHGDNRYLGLGLRYKRRPPWPWPVRAVKAKS